MRGFFTKAELASKPPISRIPYCGSCGLFRNCHSPKMPVSGGGGRKILLVGEAPGCVSGDTLIEVAFRDKTKYPKGIPIKNLVGKTDLFVYSYSIKRQKLVVSKINRVWKTGRKKVYRVTYEWKAPNGKKVKTYSNSIIVTANHPFLLKRYIKHDIFQGDKYIDSDYMSLEDGLKIGDSIQPFHRGNYKYCMIGTSWNNKCREGRFLLEYKEGKELLSDEECHHKDENKWNDEWSNLALLNNGVHTTLHLTKNNPMNNSIHRKTHSKVMNSKKYRENQSKVMKEALKNPIKHTNILNGIKKSNRERSDTVKNLHLNPEYRSNYLLGRIKCQRSSFESASKIFEREFPGLKFPFTDNHKIVSIKYIGIQDVYDMEIEKYHNFAANGIFVHNSNEDLEGKQFVGRTGRLLERYLSTHGISMRKDCWLTNSLICRPPNNATPTSKQIGYCQANLINTVEKLKPEIIVPIGDAAVESLMSWLWKEKVEGIGRWVGWTIPHQKLNCWICPIWHPSYVARQLDPDAKKKRPEVPVIWNQHLDAIGGILGRPWDTPPDYAKRVTLMTKTLDAVTWLWDLVKRGRSNHYAAFDFETTSLKPEWEGSEIVSASICTDAFGEQQTVAFLWNKMIAEVFKHFLRSPIKKIASNLKFEERWCLRKLKTHVRNWWWDTMNNGHIMDCRRQISGLKFQAFVLLGQEPYNSAVEPLLRSKPESKINQIIKEIDVKNLLLYNGLDSLLEYEVCFTQRRILGYE